MPPRETAAERLERVRGGFVAALRAGASMADAGRIVGVPDRTIQNWVARGGREPDSPFGSFALEVKDARERVPSGPLTEEELAEIVAKAARNGSVVAMKLAFEMLRAAKSSTATTRTDTLSALDELAAVRSARRGGKTS